MATRNASASPPSSLPREAPVARERLRLIVEPSALLENRATTASHLPPICHLPLSSISSSPPEAYTAMASHVLPEHFDPTTTHLTDDEVSIAFAHPSDIYSDPSPTVVEVMTHVSQSAPEIHHTGSDMTISVSFTPATVLAGRATFTSQVTSQKQIRITAHSSTDANDGSPPGAFRATLRKKRWAEKLRGVSRRSPSPVLHLPDMGGCPPVKRYTLSVAVEIDESDSGTPPVIQHMSLTGAEESMSELTSVNYGSGPSSLGYSPSPCTPNVQPHAFDRLLHRVRSWRGLNPSRAQTPAFDTMQDQLRRLSSS